MSVYHSQTQWPSLARDLAVLTVPDSPLNLKAILKAYNLGKDELATILQNPNFVRLFDREISLCEQAGSKVAVRYRATTLSQALSEKLFKDAIRGVLEPKDSLKLLDLLTHASGVMEEDKTPIAVQSNVQVNLPLPHVEKLSHCFVDAIEAQPHV